VKAFKKSAETATVLAIVSGPEILNEPRFLTYRFMSQQQCLQRLRTITVIQIVAADRVEMSDVVKARLLEQSFIYPL